MLPVSSTQWASGSNGVCRDGGAQCQQQTKDWTLVLQELVVVVEKWEAWEWAQEAWEQAQEQV